MKIVCLFIEEIRESYLFPTEKDFQLFDAVKIQGKNNKTYHGIVVEKEWALNLHETIAKIVI